MPQMNLGNGGTSQGYLAQGSKGEDVRQLKIQLKAAGFDPGPINNEFDDLTKAAVEGFQRGRGLEPDAIVGPLTRNALSQVPALTTPVDESTAFTTPRVKPTATGAVTTPLSGPTSTGRPQQVLGGAGAYGTEPTPPTTAARPGQTLGGQGAYGTEPVPPTTGGRPGQILPVTPPAVTPPPTITTPPPPTTGGVISRPTGTPATTTGGGQPAGGTVTGPTITPPGGGLPTGGVPTGGVPVGAVVPGATIPIGQGSNIAGLFNLPTGTQFAPPGVTTPNIMTPTFTAPGATPQPPAQQVTPERQALLAQLNRLQENNNPQVTYSPFAYQAPPALTYEEAQRRAAGQLNPQYQEALTDRMAALSTQMRQTGMYGQAPTIPLSQEAAARIEAARMGAVGGQANVLMSQASQEALQQRQLAQSQWGQETGLALQAQGINRDEAQRQVANILAVASAVDQQRAQEAGLTGYYGGAPTLQRTGLEAEMTGYYGGAPTWGRQAQQAQLSLSAQQAQAQAQQQAQAQSWLQQVQGAGLTGTFGGAPTLEARSAQAAAQQADIAAQQRAQEFGWQRTAQEAGLTGAYGGQPTLQARQYGTEAAAAQAQLDWQRQYQGGTLGQQQAELAWQKQYQQGQLDIAAQQAAVKPTTETNLRETALQMAQKDPNWIMVTNDAERQAIIEFYMSQLQGRAATTAPTGENDWAKQGGYVK